MVVERDSSEFARLSQLGDILGLGPLEISQVHTGLAEQAYRSQVQQVRRTFFNGIFTVFLVKQACGASSPQAPNCQELTP